ncbi:energy transducer TonB [Luteimonas aestuarii]|uniref:Energy transducer TonB n=1 Tax=Luteimonas aestuarii TaxID=453837 RepID=A0A4R5U3W7_9GAMM|nr:energy transducer TonB [Luteimonas aestuarii]TDK28329.1 energy transducer TonB [Luteimonas aestuarii]
MPASPAATPPSPRQRWWPRSRGWWLVAGAFAAGLLLFLVLWLGKRDEFAFYRTEGTPRTADGQVFEPLPVPLPAGELPASGMDDRDPPPSGGARIDQQAPAPVPAAPAPTAPSTPTATPPSAGVAAIPRLVHAPPPEYPRDALRSGATGEVVIRIDVGPDGRPASLEVVRSSRNRSLDRAALQAVRQWRFEPAMRDGTPVAASVQQTVTFN